MTHFRALTNGGGLKILLLYIVLNFYGLAIYLYF